MCKEQEGRLGERAETGEFSEERRQTSGGKSSRANRKATVCFDVHTRENQKNVTNNLTYFRKVQLPAHPLQT